MKEKSIYIFISTYSRHQRAYGIHEKGVQSWKPAVLDCSSRFALWPWNGSKDQKEGQRNLGVSH